MAVSFKTILVPVDFSENTDVAVKKALELADPDQCVIHLLHVLQLPAVAYISVGQTVIENSNRATCEADAKRKLRQWQEAMTDRASNTCVRTHLVQGEQIQKAIIRKANELAADLVVIGKKSTHPWLPFRNTVRTCQVARKAGCAVLTVKPGALHHKVKTLVVPVTNQVPLHKLEAIQAIGRNFRIRIHLVTFVNEAHVPESFSASSLLQVYQWLKTAVQCPVEYTVLHGASKPKAVLLYAEKIDADLLLLHPVSETRIRWPDTHLSDVLSPASKVQVLLVQPALS